MGRSFCKIFIPVCELINLKKRTMMKEYFLNWVSG